jgi:hypothetical protein
VKAIKIIESVVPELESPSLLHNVSRFSEVNADSLADIVDDVIEFRKSQVNSILKSLDSIFNSYMDNAVDNEKQQSTEQDNPQSSNVNVKHRVTEHIGDAERNTIASMALIPVEQK